MKNVTTLIYLVIAGILLIAVGGAIVFMPHTFHGSNGITLGDNPNLLSEVRAPGALLLCSGVAILMGAIRQQLRHLALTLSVLVYTSFGLSRLVSMVIDGMPSSSIVGAALIEVSVGLVGLLIVYRAQARRAANANVSTV